MTHPAVTTMPSRQQKKTPKGVEAAEEATRKSTVYARMAEQRALREEDEKRRKEEVSKESHQHEPQRRGVPSKRRSSTLERAPSVHPERDISSVPDILRTTRVGSVASTPSRLRLNVGPLPRSKTPSIRLLPPTKSPAPSKPAVPAGSQMPPPDWLPSPVSTYYPPPNTFHSSMPPPGFPKELESSQLSLSQAMAYAEQGLNVMPPTPSKSRVSGSQLSTSSSQSWLRHPPG